MAIEAPLDQRQTEGSEFNIVSTSPTDRLQLLERGNGLEGELKPFSPNGATRDRR